MDATKPGSPRSYLGYRVFFVTWFAIVAHDIKIYIDQTYLSISGSARTLPATNGQMLCIGKGSDNGRAPENHSDSINNEYAVDVV